MVEKEAKSATEQLDPVLKGTLPACASVFCVVGYEILREYVGFMDRAEIETVFHWDVILEMPSNLCCYSVLKL